LKCPGSNRSGAAGEPARAARRNGPSAACRVVYEDDWIVAVEKPCGLPTAHTPAGQASVFNWLQERWLATGSSPKGRSHGFRRAPGGAARGRQSPSPFVGVVSRLDQPVSGIVIFAKSPVAAASLAEQFRTRTVEKTYLALVEGRFPGRVGAWCHWQDQLPRLPHGGDRPRPHESPAEDKGQEAVTAVRLLERAAEVSLVELQPGTGRRHQLRRQLADRRCPIVGDRRYGSRIPLAEAAIALHALAVRFAHPEDQRPTLVRSQPPRLWFERFPVIQGLGTGM